MIIKGAVLLVIGVATAAISAYSSSRQLSGVYPSPIEIGLLGAIAITIAVGVGVVLTPLIGLSLFLITVTSYVGGFALGQRFRPISARQSTAHSDGTPPESPVVRDYIKVKPTSERIMPDDIADRIRGFRKINDGLSRRLNPFKQPPKFESLVLTHGDDEPIKFLIRIEDEHEIETLRTQLKSMYPDSYDIERVSVNLSKELLPEDVYEERYGGLDEDLDRESSREYFSLSDFKGVEPHGVHWYGKEERRRDWQTLSKQFTQQTKRQRQKEETKRRQRAAPISSLIEEMAAVNHPVALQVVFYRRRRWSHQAQRRKSRLEQGTDTTSGLVMQTVSDFLGIETEDKNTDSVDEGESAREKIDDTGIEVGSRAEHIDNKGASETYKVNLRCLAFPEAESVTEAEIESELEAISNSINHLSGPYYNITGRVAQDGIREKLGKRPTRMELLEDFVNREIRVSLLPKTKLQLILNADELANYITAPSSDALSHEGARGVQHTQESQAPLSLPHPDILNAYTQQGVEIGYPLNENRDEYKDPIRIPAQVLHHHYLRSAATGSGKSVATENELLSFNKYTSGPNILIEPKGGDMVIDYLAAHYEEFGDLDDVICFKLPKDLPGIPFFDIRPALAAGYDRKDAILDKTEQFDEIMRLVMDEDEYRKAENSINLLKLLIQALFDHKHGSDAYTIRELSEALSDLIQKEQLPRLSDKNDHVRRRIQDLKQEDQQFSMIAAGAGNRLSILTRDDRLREMLNYIPEWEHRPDGTAGYKQGFNFRDILYEDKTVILDVGDLRTDTGKIISLMVLGHLWNTIKIERYRGDLSDHIDTRVGDKPDDYVVGCIIEEAKELGDSSLITDLLAWGREFGICLGLVLQFADQLDDQQSNEDVYSELIENVHTKMLGKTQMPKELAEMLAHDEITAEEFQSRLRYLPSGEWVVRLKSPEWFGKEPKPFSVKSMPFPDGHPESDNPLEGHKKERFKKTLRDCLDQVGESYCVPEDPASQSISTASTSSDGSSVTPAENIIDEDGESTLTTDDTDSNQPTPDSPSVQSNGGGHNGTSPMGSEPQHDSSDGNPTNDAANSEINPSLGESPVPPSSQSTFPDSSEQEDSLDSSQRENKVDETKTTSTSQRHQKESEAAQNREAESSTNGQQEITSVDDPDFGMDSQLSERQRASPQGAQTTRESASVSNSPSSTSSTISDDETKREDEDLPAVTDESGRYIGLKYRKSVSDAEMEAMNLSKADVHFLSHLLAVFNGEMPESEYSLDQSMTKLPGHQQADVSHLLDDGFIEKTQLRNYYFDPTPKTYDLFSAAQPSGEEGVGDLGEKVIHRVGCYLTAKVFDEICEEVKRYYTYNGNKFDVIGFDAEGDAQYVAEIETASNNYESVLDDFDKIQECNAYAFWVTEDIDTREQIISIVQDNRNAYQDIPKVRLGYDELEEQVTDNDPSFKSIYSLFDKV